MQTGAYEKIRKMADIILREIQSAANAAKGELAKMKPQSFPKLSQGNDAAVEQEVHRHERLKRRRKNLERMTKEPFLAYVKTKGDGGESVYLIYRGEGPGASSGESGVGHASYFSPAGRSAELDPGDELELPETTETVVEKNRFTPREKNEVWDATENRILLSGLEERPPSLREFLLKILDVEAEDLPREIRELEIRRQKAEEESRKRKRQILDHFVLRDRPILDSRQGGIFRLPLSGGVVVTGAPGTGKTTLLIKRIAKNTSPEFVDSEDVGELNEKDKEGLFHPKNWMFFVPSEHLRLYLKESLAADDLSASNQTVKVWADESKNLARAFDLIGPGKPLQSTAKPTFADNASSSLTARANDFWAWQETRVKRKLTDAQKEFASSENRSEMAKRVAAIVAVDALAVLRQMENMRAEIDKRRRDMNKAADALADLALRTPKLRESIADIYPDKSEPDDENDSDAAEPPETVAAKARPRDEKLQIKQRVKSTIFWRARQMRAKSGARKGGKLEKLWEKIAPQLSGSGDELRALSGIDAEIQPLGFLATGLDYFVNGVPGQYRQFRREQLRDRPEIFACRQNVEDNRVSDAEIDIVNFTILRNARRANYARSKPIMQEIESRQKTQIAVDEAADFSALQLGCMYYLANPRFNSFSIVGDLMQRMTESGIRDFAECELFAKNMRSCAVERAYRQSGRLLEIAAILYRESMGCEPPFRAGYKESGENDPPPLLRIARDDAADANDAADAKWIASRVREVYQAHAGKLPPTAIFVSTNEQIEKFDSFLKEELGQFSIETNPCRDGKMVGGDGKVNIFPIKFIKGLEFEAVFFVGINELLRDLAGQYLYVGLTRAAQFLAVTCRGDLPAQFLPVEGKFESGNASWVKWAGANETDLGDEAAHYGESTE